MTVRPKIADVREACVAEAFRIVEEAGVESLSLRDVARRLGVSHQAPYKHFPSRGHMLAEIIARSFDDFSAFLQSRPSENEPKADLQAMGSLYMAYARQHPLQYRLMFNTPMPDPGQHPEMMAKARFAFGILRDRLAQMPLRPVVVGTARTCKLAAIGRVRDARSLGSRGSVVRGTVLRSHRLGAWRLIPA